MKTIVILLCLGIFSLLVACKAEEALEPTPAAGPSIAEVLAEQLTATSTIEATIVPSQTPQPTDTSVAPTPTEITQQSAETAAAIEVPVENITLRVLPDSVSLRRGPGTIYQPIGYLFAEDEVIVLARDAKSTWYNVLAADDMNGWVAASVTELLGEEALFDSIEIAATIPVPPTLTPTPTSTSTPTPLPLPTPRRSSGGGGKSSGGDGNGYPPPDDPPPPRPTENSYP